MVGKDRFTKIDREWQLRSTCLQYPGAVRQLHWPTRPMAHSSDSSWPTVQVVYKRVADMIANKLNKSYSTIIRLLRCRLCSSLLRSTITCLRGSRHSKINFTNLLTTDPVLVVAEGWVTRWLICISWSYTNLNYYIFFSFSLSCYCTIIIIFPDLKKISWNIILMKAPRCWCLGAVIKLKVITNIYAQIQLCIILQKQQQL